MKSITDKLILFLLLLLCLPPFINAQSIKASAEQKKRQQEYERELKELQIKEEARIQKSKLNYNNLIHLLQSKDLDYIDRFLSEKGWKLYSTYVNDDNNEELPKGFKSITWTFDKKEYYDLALGWFYFYIYPQEENMITYDNAIGYVLSDDMQLNKLKSELINNGFVKSQPTNASSTGLESVYKNDTYEVNFKKQISESDYGKSEYQNVLLIYNYKNILEKQLELERIKREKEEKEEKYKNAIKQAEIAYSNKQFKIAKQSYLEAIELKKENKEKLTKIISDLEIDMICENANLLFNANQFEKAKSEYQKALLIKPNSRTEEILTKIKRVDDFITFLNDRIIKKFDLKDIDKTEYNACNQIIEDELKVFLLNELNLSKTQISIVSEIDTLGVAKTSFSTNSDNLALKNKLNEIVKKTYLKPVFINGYNLNIFAEFNYIIEANHDIVVANKKAEYIKSNNENFKLYSSKINNELLGAPIGKYTFNMNTAFINNHRYEDYNLIKVKGTGGPSNAFLSLLVPGLGLKNVSGGKTSGLSTALWTYGLIGAGIGFKAWSNKEYEAYHLSIVQTDIDEHYDMANNLNSLFYVSVGAGILMWIGDIIIVTNRGFKNQKLQKVWKNTNLEVYYDTKFNSSGLSYIINF